MLKFNFTDASSLSWYLGKRVKSALYILYTSIIVPKVQWGSGLRKGAWYLKDESFVVFSSSVGMMVRTSECWASKIKKSKVRCCHPIDRTPSFFNKQVQVHAVSSMFLCFYAKHVKCVVFLRLMTALFQKAGFRMGRVTEILTGEAELELRGGVFLQEEEHSALWEGAISINHLCLSVKCSDFEGESHKIKQSWI